MNVNRAIQIIKNKSAYGAHDVTKAFNVVEAYMKTPEWLPTLEEIATMPPVRARDLRVIIERTAARGDVLYGIPEKDTHWHATFSENAKVFHGCAVRLMELGYKDPRPQQ